MPAVIFERSTTESVENTHKYASSGSLRNLLITLVALVAFCLILVAGLFLLRRIRRSKKDAGTLPSYDAATRNNRGNRLTIQTNRDSAFVYSEKQNLIDSSSPMPQTPDNVPEIRITFPEEQDKDGRLVSGRVVVVQVGEAGVGFVRPLEQPEGLPPYQPNQQQERFNSIDIDRIGGLKELR